MWGLKLEIWKICRLPTYRWVILIVAGLLGLSALWSVYAQQRLGYQVTDGWFDMLTVTIAVGNLGLLVVAAQFISGEYSQRTLQLTLASGMSRRQYAFNKALALVAASYLLVDGLLIVITVLTVVLGLLQGDTSFLMLPWGWLILGLLLLPLANAPLLLGAMWVTTVTRSNVVTIAVLMVYSTVGEFLLHLGLLRSPLAPAADYLPGKVGQDIVTGVLETDSYLSAIILAVLGIVSYVCLFTLGSWWHLQRQDLSR